MITKQNISNKNFYKNFIEKRIILSPKNNKSHQLRLFKVGGYNSFFSSKFKLFTPVIDNMYFKPTPISKNLDINIPLISADFETMQLEENFTTKLFKSVDKNYFTKSFSFTEKIKLKVNPNISSKYINWSRFLPEKKPISKEKKRKPSNAFLSQAEQIKKEQSLIISRPQVVVLAGFYFNNTYTRINLKPSSLRLYNSQTIEEASLELIENFILNLINKIDVYLKPFKESFKTTKKKFTCYFHNFARFDSYFLVKAIFKSSKLKKIFNYSKQLRIFQSKNAYFRVMLGPLVFLDSYKLLASSLNNLSKIFLGKEKENFPIERNRYNDIVKVFSNFKTFKQYISYNKSDCVLLHDILEQFRKIIFTKYTVDITKSISSSSLALSIFSTNYYVLPKSLYIDFVNKKEKKTNNSNYTIVFNNNKIPITKSKRAIFFTEPYLENGLRDAYYGGRTELFRPYCKTTRGVDRNSLYPYACSMDMPTGKPVQINKNTWTKNDFLKFFGFFKIDFCSPADSKLLPVLPRRFPQSKNSAEKYNVFALGIGKNQWYFSEEVQLAYNMGYKIKIKEAYSYDKFPILKNFILDLYSERLKHPSKSPLNFVYKLLLNIIASGRFALKIHDPKTEFIFNDFNNDFVEESEKLFSSKEVSIEVMEELQDVVKTKQKPSVSKKSLFKAKAKAITFIQNYSNGLDLNLSKEESFKKLSEDYQKQSSPIFPTSFYSKGKSAVHMSACTTSRARCIMYPLLNKLYQQNSLCYTDTDSMYYDETNQVSNDLITSEIDPKTLGFFKVEISNYEMFFIGHKLYYGFNPSNKTESILKLKGIPKETLTPEVQEQITNELINSLIEGKYFNIFTQVSNRLKTDTANINIVSIPSMNINFQNLTIDRYRSRVYKNNKWVNTESKILDSNYNNISLAELKELYDFFRSNII